MAMKTVSSCLVNLECSICLGNLADPRLLPCGHSYCGPPRDCLKTLMVSNGLKCAICNQQHNLEPESLSPMYHIRDLLGQVHEISEKKQKRHRLRAASSQKNLNDSCSTKGSCTNEERYHCNTCDINVCDECWEENHDGHLVELKSTYYKKQSRKLIESQPFQVKLMRLGEAVEGFESLMAILEDWKISILQTKSFVQDVLGLVSTIDSEDYEASHEEKFSDLKSWLGSDPIETEIIGKEIEGRMRKCIEFLKENDRLSLQGVERVFYQKQWALDQSIFGKTGDISLGEPIRIEQVEQEDSQEDDVFYDIHND